MNINVSNIKLEAEYVIHNPPNHLRLDFTIYEDGVEYGHFFGVYSRKAIKQFVKQLRGEVDWTEKFAFDDLSRVITVTEGNIAIYYYSSRGVTHLILPGPELAAYIEHLVHGMRPGQTRSGLIDERTTWQWKHKYAANTKVLFTEEAWNLLQAQMVGPYKESLSDCLAGWIRIAQNASNGDLTTLNVYAEQPSSFYVSVEKHGERYMNGGIILHGDRGYSSHS